MSIFKKVIDIMQANINDLLEKAEDPVKTAKLELDKRIDMLAECKEDTAEVIASEKAAERELQSAKEASAKFEAIAEKALLAAAKADTDAKRDECNADAATAIAEKQKYDKKVTDLEKTYEAAKESSAKMRDLTEKLTSDIESLKARLDAIEATAKVANAQEAVNKSSKYTNAELDSRFDAAEKKVQSRLDKAAAKAEMAQTAGAGDKLTEKYSGGSASVDDELDALRKKLGL